MVSMLKPLIKEKNMTTQVLGTKSLRDEAAEAMSEFLKIATPQQLTEFVGHLEQNKIFKSRDMNEIKNHMKAYFTIKVIRMLGIKRYEIRNIRQKIVLDVHEDTGSIYLYSNTRAAEDKDTLYAKIYDLHKEQLLELVSKHEAKSLVPNGFSFSPSAIQPIEPELVYQ
jgi:hypothetical protein